MILVWEDGFLHHRVLNQMLDLSAVLWFRSLWYTPLPSALPAHTLRKIPAAVYIWNIKECVCISLSCLLTGHGGAEQKQPVRAAFSKIFSKLHLRIFAISRRLKNAHKRKHQGVLCVSWSRGADPHFIGAGARAVMEAGLLLWCSSCISSWCLLELFMAKLHGGTWRKTTTRPVRRTPHGQWSASAARQEI